MNRSEWDITIKDYAKRYEKRFVVFCEKANDFINSGWRFCDTQYEAEKVKAELEMELNGKVTR